MKNKGFTLVELLAVIVILGILLTIAIPSVLRVSNNVREKSYDTKIQMIESSAVVYGENNLRDTLAKRSNSHDGICWLKLTEENKKVKVNYSNGYVEGYYPCKELTLNDLVKSGDLKYDDEDAGQIINPVNDVDIKGCSVYVYFRNNRIYSAFDRVKCDNDTVPTEEEETSTPDADLDVEDTNVPR